MVDLIGETTKTSTEKIPIAVDFKDVIPNGETLDVSASTFTVTDENGADVTSAMLQQKVVTGTQVLGIIKAGSSGLYYIIKAFAITSNYQFEGSVKLLVAD